jgi:hypothetical protein
MSSLWRVLLILAAAAAVLVLKPTPISTESPRDDDLGRVGCSGSHCVAPVAGGTLDGMRDLHRETSVCRVSWPGEDFCKVARRHFNL